MRAVSRTTGVAGQTVSDLLEHLGYACSAYQDKELRNLPSTIIEADEIWSFCHNKARNTTAVDEGVLGFGDVWTWTAIDAETKLVPSWLVDERSLADCYTFLADLRDRMTPGNRIPLTTDGLGHYAVAADAIWRNSADFAQIVKHYGCAGNADNEQRYSPAVCTGMEIHVRSGSPDPAHISSSYVATRRL